MPISSAQELFIHELCEIYDAEHRLIEGQQEMIEYATDEKLKGAIGEHLEQTRQHAVNIERLFAELGREARCETNERSPRDWSARSERAQEAQIDALPDCVIVSRSSTLR